ALLRALDPGTMASDEAWPLRLTSLAVTLFGVLLVSTVIGITATGISARLGRIGRGRAPMIESGHTLVLGWSPKVQTLVAELAKGREGDRGASLVILAGREKAEMDEHVAGWTRAAPRLRVVTRTGEPHVANDLRIVNPQLARSVVVMRNGTIDGDARVIKTVLALLYDLKVPDDIPIVAELSTGASAEALRSVVGDRVVVVETGNLAARVIAQACRHPGVDRVLAELFDYSGSEIYTRRIPQVVGMSLADTALCFERSVPIGLITADGRVSVRPPGSTVVAEDDQLVVIAEDASSIHFRPAPDVSEPSPVPERPSATREPERALMFGFNEFAPLVLEELNDYVPHGSTITVVADPDLVGDLEGRLPTNLANLGIQSSQARLAPGVVRKLLAETDPDYVIVLCCRGSLTPTDADARTLMAFLEIGGAITTANMETNVVAELLDAADIALVPADWSDQLVLTEHLSSLFLTQVSENVNLAPVFDDLLDAEGTEIYCKPIHWYGRVDHTATFATLTLAAQRRDEIAIGYRRKRHEAALGNEVLINPPKSAEFVLNEGDALIVLASHER
ncbi:MAG: hypothetical protein WA988_08575, partial [Candidatus Nanopelagicales bacterium]